MPNAETAVRLPSIAKAVKINSSGYYGPEFPPKERKSGLRIAVAGASNASGVWMNGQQTFAMELERLLRLARPDSEVLNFGVDGSGRSLATLLLVESDVLSYSPSLVLLEWSFPISNEVVFREEYRGYLGDIGKSTMPPARIRANRDYFRAYVDELEAIPLTHLFDCSFVFRALHKKICALHKERRQSPLEGDSITLRLQHYKTKRVYLTIPRQRMNLKASLDRLTRTKDLVAAAGATLVVFSYTEFKGDMQENLARAGIRTLALGIPADRSLHHKYDGHYNQKGHLLIAEVLLEKLHANGLLE